MPGSDHLSRIKNQGNLVFKSRFLQNFSKIERYEFLQLCHRRDYKKNEFVYHQSDPGTGMYFIEMGKVQLNSKVEGSEEQINRVLQSPESFGLLSIAYDLRRFATVQCITDCTLLGFFKPDFEALKKRQPQIAVKFMESLAVITMQQLSIIVNELKEPSETRRIVARLFDAYYSDDESQENNL